MSGKSGLAAFGLLIVVVLAINLSGQGTSPKPVTAPVPPPPAPVEIIPGNEAHNFIARENTMMRSYSLAELVKKMAGKARCSGEKSLYRGQDKSHQAFWSVQCHDGTSYMVGLKKSGDGEVMDCSIVDMINKKPGGCWKTFAQEKAEKKAA